MEPRDFGWTQVAGKEMYATPISDGVALAPDALLKVVTCTVVVKSSEGQKGVDADNVTLHACSVFCACQGGHRCFNEKTRQTLQADEDDVDEDDDIYTWHFANNPCNEKHNKSLLPYMKAFFGHF